MDKKITVQDVFQQFLPEYSEVHRFSSQQQLSALCISKCRTIEMGANLSECEDCHRKYIHYNSCKNRHCPMCQGMEVDEWIDKQQENVLDVPYFHTVFTVPKELYPLMYCNQKLLYDTLYHGTFCRSKIPWCKDRIYLCSSYMGIPTELSSASSYDRAWRRT